MLAKDIFDSGHLGYQRELLLMVTITKKMQLFFSQAFFDKIFMFLSKNSISRSAKQFCEVDLNS